MYNIILCSSRLPISPLPIGFGTICLLASASPSISLRNFLYGMYLPHAWMEIYSSSNNYSPQQDDLSCTSPSRLLPSSGSQFELKHCPSAISCPDCFFYMLKWILILPHTINLHNKMMCHAHHPAVYSQGQGHSLGSNIDCPEFRVLAVSSTCLNRF